MKPKVMHSAAGKQMFNMWHLCFPFLVATIFVLMTVVNLLLPLPPQTTAKMSSSSSSCCRICGNCGGGSQY
jgi:hypothetical protein